MARLEGGLTLVADHAVGLIKFDIVTLYSGMRIMVHDYCGTTR